jgi:hypothetical protein
MLNILSTIIIIYFFFIIIIIQLNQINFQKRVLVRVILITSFDQFNPIYPRAYGSSWCIELCLFKRRWSTWSKYYVQLLFGVVSCNMCPFEKSSKIEVSVLLILQRVNFVYISHASLCNQLRELYFSCVDFPQPFNIYWIKDSTHVTVLKQCKVKCT